MELETKTLKIEMDYHRVSKDILKYLRPIKSPIGHNLLFYLMTIEDSNYEIRVGLDTLDDFNKHLERSVSSSTFYTNLKLLVQTTILEKKKPGLYCFNRNIIYRPYKNFKKPETITIER